MDACIDKLNVPFHQYLKWQLKIETLITLWISYVVTAYSSIIPPPVVFKVLKACSSQNSVLVSNQWILLKMF